MLEELHPKKTKLLLGHDKQLNTFKIAIKNKKLHHSWILEGPEGIGKSTFAYFIARSMLAHNPKDVFFNNKNFYEDNPVNNQIINNVHPDLKVIENTIQEKGVISTSNIIPVSKVREIENFFSKKPSFGGWRICIIDSLDKLNTYGLNSLLKILEEPPEKSLILAISNSKTNILSTLRSRCSILRFSALNNYDCSKILNNILVNIDNDELQKLMILSEGSPGKALIIYNNKGLKLYELIIRLFLNIPTISISSIEDINDILVHKSNIDGLRIIKIIFAVFISRTYRRHYNIISDEVSKDEIKSQINCLKKLNLDNLSTFWDKIYDIMNQAVLLNLDKKQTILEMINELTKVLSNEENYVLNDDK